MSVSIKIYTTRYAPWEDGADEREDLGTESESIEFDNARECADYLMREGIQCPSDSHPCASTWLEDVDSYEHPYTGVLIVQSAHAENVHPRVWAAIVRAVRWSVSRG